MNDVIVAIFRHKGKATVFFLGVMVLVIFFTWLAPRKYRSEGKLFLRLGRENATLDPTATFGDHSIVAIPQSRENEINSVAEMLQSRVLLEKVIDKLGPAVVLEREEVLPNVETNIVAATVAPQSLTRTIKNGLKVLLGLPILSDRENAYRQLARNLQVARARKSDVIDIAFCAGSPELAQAVVAATIDSYIDEHVRLNRPQGSHEFFAKQTERLHNEVVGKEQALCDLKNRTGMASSVDQRQQLIARLGRLEEDLLKTETARAVARAKVEKLRKVLAEVPATEVAQEVSGHGNEGTDRMRDQLYALQIKEKEAAAKYTDDHPKLQEIRDQLLRAKKVLAKEELTRTQVTKAPGRLYLQARLDLLAEEPLLASLDARSSKLHDQLSAARQEMKVFNADALRVAELQREVDLLDSEYRKYSTSLEQARIDQALELRKMSNINIAQRATFEPNPISPRPLLNLILGLSVGLFGAVGLCMICAQMERTPKEVEEEKKPISTFFAALQKLKAK
ncbi:MAG: GumC family protein [Thermoguttaceae bacterium]